jgi:YD repeat-containing protein
MNAPGGTRANTDATPATISSFDYTLDAAGNRTAMEDLDGTHSYEYDPLYRLTEVTYPDPETDAYTYDSVGNRLTRDSDDYTYDAADQLTDLEGTSFDYDDNGNQTERGTDTFEYDHENRLTASEIDSVGATYGGLDPERHTRGSVESSLQSEGLTAGEASVHWDQVLGTSPNRSPKRACGGRKTGRRC